MKSTIIRVSLAALVTLFCIDLLGYFGGLGFNDAWRDQIPFPLRMIFGFFWIISVTVKIPLFVLFDEMAVESSSVLYILYTVFLAGLTGILFSVIKKKFISNK